MHVSVRAQTIHKCCVNELLTLLIWYVGCVGSCYDFVMEGIQALIAAAFASKQFFLYLCKRLDFAIAHFQMTFQASIRPGAGAGRP